MFDEAPPDDWWSKWVLGTAVSLLLATHGLWCIATERAWLPGRRVGRAMSLHDADAIAFGVAVLAGAALLHVHYFWSHVERLAPYVDLGKLVSVLVLVAAMCVLIFRIVFLG